MSYRRGQWLALCDRCGFRYLSGQLKLEWTGLRTCHDCWEPRHEQDFVKGVKESTIPWSRPEPYEVTIGGNLYVAAGYWDNPSVVPPATVPSEEYVS